MPGGIFLSKAALERLNKGKRRPLNPLSWKDNMNKIKKDKGEQYEVVKGRRAGMTVNAVEPPSGTKICRCKKSGCNLNRASYIEFFEAFRAKSYDEQSNFIASCIKLETPLQRTVEQENVIKFKKHTYRYALKLRGEEHATCRQRLCDTFGILPSRLRSLIRKMEEGNLSYEDGRGKTCGVNPKLLTEAFKDRIRNHIRSFPTYESHYCRDQAGDARLYLDEELTVTKMLSLFNEVQAENRDRICKFDAYNNVFKTEFDLRFGLPRKDTCNFCDSQTAIIARTTNQNEVDTLREALLHHQEVARAARLMHTQDGNNEDPGTHSITADMQKVLFVPRLSCSSAYFKRKLSTFNLGIHTTGKEDATMYLWDETVAEHASKDVLSCVYKHILSHFQPLLPKTERKLIIWSDRFVGQFNNCFFVLFMKYLVDSKYFTSVEHKFFATGHSWMSCDRDFGLIEKRYKKMNPLVPSDIEGVISSARINNPFQICKMESKDFLNFSILPEFVTLPNNLQVTRYLWYMYEASTPNTILAKPFHNSLEWQRFKLVMKKPTGFLRLKRLPPSYAGPVQLNAAKAKDLRDLMEKIPDAEKHAYYDRITNFLLN